MPEEHFCERCGEKLNPATLKFLEMDSRNNLYSDPEKAQVWPADQSQGLFAFGKACAREVLRLRGHVQTVGARRAANHPKRRK